MSRRRVVITGMGTVNPLAQSVAGYWPALLAGKSGIGPITQFDTTLFRVHFGGEVKDWQPDRYIEPKTARHLDRFAQFALAAAKEAVADSGVRFDREDPYRCGSIIGSGIGGVKEVEGGKGKVIARGAPQIRPHRLPHKSPHTPPPPPPPPD